MTEEKHGLKVPVFDGEEKNFQKWWLRFQAFATVKGFRVALDKPQSTDYYPNNYEDFLALDPNDADTKVMAKRLIQNNVAIAQLTLAFESEGLLNKVYACQDDNWPEGMAWKVIESLLEEYQPKDRISKVEMRRRLNKVKMGKKDNPKVLFEQLAAIENAFNSADSEIGRR